MEQNENKTTEQPQDKKPLRKLMEGVFTVDEVTAGMRKTIDGFVLPVWLREERACPECKEKIPIEGIFGFGVKLNAQHFGNFFVETLCPKCHAGFEWHFQDACPDLKSFNKVLSYGTDVTPVPHHQISSSKNNLMERMLKEKEDKAKKDRAL
jgi:hypothetical protein